MSGGSFESSQRTEPVCASRFSSIKNCFKTRASGLARGRGWSRIGHSDRLAHTFFFFFFPGLTIVIIRFWLKNR